MSMSPTSPAEIFGGTWEALDEGRVLIGANTEYPVGATGGEKTHALTTAEMPSHNHTMVSTGSHIHSGSTTSVGAHEHIGGTIRIWDAASGYYGVAYTSTDKIAFPLARWESDYYDNLAKFDLDYTNTTGAHSHSLTINSAGSHSHTINNAGSGNAHNIMQPYLSVYMWKRTA